MKHRVLALALILSLFSLPVLARTDATEAPAADENFFAQRAFTFMDNAPFDAGVLDGKPILINIWATWCPPCVAEMPHLDTLAKEYADRIAIVGLHAEGLTITEAEGIVPNDATNAEALALAREAGYTYTLLNPDATLFYVMNSADYGLQVEVLPTTWLVDSEGYIRRIVTGGRDEEGWREVIDDFLALLEGENAPPSD